MKKVCSHYRGLNVIVTGGLGFIGSNLARRLVDLGAKVTVLDSLHPNTGANLANLNDVEDKLRLCIVDLRSGGELERLLPGQDVIFNLAGLVSHIDSMRDPVADLESNVHAQIVLLETCRRCVPDIKIVFASTRQIYGRPSSCPVDESYPLRPVDINGINTIAGEAYHTLYQQVYGLQTVSLRLTNTYGPRMRIKDARQTFLGIWVRRVVEGGVFEVWGGHQMRDLTYVEDAVDAFLIAAALSVAGGRIFNIGGCPPLSLAELAERLVKIAGKGRFEIRAFPPELLRIDIGNYYTDDRLFRQLTGWAPKMSLIEGLKRTVAYYESRINDYV